MTADRKSKLVEAAVASVGLPVLTEPLMWLGLPHYVGLLILSVVLYVVLGARIRMAPAIVVGFACGQAYGFVTAWLMQQLGAPLGATFAGLVAPIIVIFVLLTVHENLLANTLFGLAPAVLTGFGTSMLTSSLVPGAGAAANPLQVLAIWTYGALVGVVVMHVARRAAHAASGQPVAASADAPQESVR